MAGGSRHTAPARGDTLDLPTMALARPGEALARARAVIAAHPGPHEASVARQTIGIVLRDFGNVSAALGELRAALRLADAAGSAERHADVQATLGLTLVTAGRAEPGLAALDAAARQASGAQAGRIRYRRGAALWLLGQQREALTELNTAVAALRRADDPIWQARALSARAMVRLALGANEQANVDFGHAERLLTATSQELELAFARQNWALVAFRSGDLPAALAHFDEAALRYQALAVPMPPDLTIDRCAVLLAAGLAADALREADLAIGALDRTHGQAIKKAELLLTAAGAALGVADPRTAIRRAEAAARLFSAQQRPWWHAHARLVLLQARYAAGLVTGQLLLQAARNADSLEALGSSDAPQAHLLAGRAGLALARMKDAERHLHAAARARRHGPALARVDGWLAEALLAEAAASPRRALGACRRGFDVLDDHRLSLGASELRARATARGGELAALAQRQALRAGRPRMLLFWSERWRATTLALPPVRPVEGQALQAELTALRYATSRLETSQAQGTPAPRLQREQLRLERAIRARAIRARGTGRSGQQGFGAAALLRELGDATLIQIVEIGGDLHPLVCGAGQVRHFAAGRVPDAAREVSFARFGLNRIAHTRATVPRNALALLDAAGARLQDILLGPAAAHLGGGPVIVVPPGRLHAVPWALLPCLRDRVLSVAPSCSAWMRASAAAPAGRGVVLIRGPDLGSQGAEVPALAAEYDDAIVLGDGSATAARVLAAIDGSLLAHIAAHGNFRADSPLFSSLRLDDGPLTVHDLERLGHAPHRLILPSCESGLLAPTGADELLGLASALVPLGTAGIVASITRVNDKATVSLMLALHQRLRRGGTLSESLRDARSDVGDDPVQMATGWSFVALGAG